MASEDPRPSGYLAASATERGLTSNAIARIVKERGGINKIDVLQANEAELDMIYQFFKVGELLTALGPLFLGLQV